MFTTRNKLISNFRYRLLFSSFFFALEVLSVVWESFESFVQLVNAGAAKSGADGIEEKERSICSMLVGGAYRHTLLPQVNWK